MTAFHWRPGRPTLDTVRAHLQDETHGDETRRVACFDVDDRGSFGRVYARITDTSSVWEVRTFAWKPSAGATPGAVEVSPPTGARYRPVDILTGEARPWQDLPTGEVLGFLQWMKARNVWTPASFLASETVAETARERGWIALGGSPGARRYKITDAGRAALERAKKVSE